jgi:hypothetical protein
MNVSVGMDNLEPMTVWVPEAFLLRGLIEELDGMGGSEFGIIDLTEDN